MDTSCEYLDCDKTVGVIATTHLSSPACETLSQEVAVYRTRAEQSHCYIACQLLYPQGIEVTLEKETVITVIS